MEAGGIQEVEQARAEVERVKSSTEQARETGAISQEERDEQVARADQKVGEAFNTYWQDKNNKLLNSHNWRVARAYANGGGGGGGRETSGWSLGFGRDCAAYVSMARGKLVETFKWVSGGVTFEDAGTDLRLRACVLVRARVCACVRVCMDACMHVRG